MHAIRICPLFFIFNLTCYKFVALKENTLNHSFQKHYSKQTKHFRIFLIERLGCHTKGGNWRRVPPFAGYHSQSAFPPPITDHILEKKVSLIAFREILPKILPAMYIFSNRTMANLKMLIWDKSLNKKQCLAGLSPRIIPLNRYGKPWEWWRIPANSQKFTNFPLQKNHFHLITLYKLHL